MEFEKILNKKNIFTYLMLLAIIILLLPTLTRLLSQNSTYLGPNAYYHARMAKTIKENGIPSIDGLSYGGREYSPHIYHLILAGASNIIPLNILLFILPFILGISSLILFYLILKKLRQKRQLISLSILILIMSPIFIYLFTTINQNTLPIFLNLIAIYLFLSKPKHKYLFLSKPRNKKYLFAIIPLTLAAFFGPLHAVAPIIFLFFLASTKNKKSKAIKLSIPATIILLFYHLPFYLKNGIHLSPNFVKINFFNSFISEFGPLISFGIFAIILTLMGIMNLKENKKTTLFYIITLGLLFISYHIINLRIYLNFIVAFLAAHSFLILINQKWELKTIKKLTVLIIVCGLLFSTVVQLNTLSNSDPAQDIKFSLEWLKNQPPGKVFSHYSKGFWIQGMAEKPTIMDPLFNNAPNLETTYKDSELLFNSRRIKNNTEIINKYDITYIWIDKKMKSGQVWINQDQGLLFLLQHSDNFKNIYSLNNIEIWMYTKKNNQNK